MSFVVVSRNGYAGAVFKIMPMSNHVAYKHETCTNANIVIFTRESSCCFQRVLVIAILSVCLSVCPSHGWISQKPCMLGLGLPNFHRRLSGRL